MEDEQQKKQFLSKLKKILLFKIGPNVNYSRFNPLKFNWGKIKNFCKTLLVVFSLVLLILIIVDIVKYDFLGDDGGDDELAYEISGQVIDYLDENYIFPDYAGEENCNVQGIELRGELVTYIENQNYDEEGYPIVDQAASENIAYLIEQAEKDNSIKAILLEIDSLGGYPTAAEEVLNALKRAKKPTVAFIREYGLSGAYYSAVGADVIFAAKNSDVGGIGVTMSYLDYTEQDKNEGIKYIQISSGKFKDTGDPDKPLTNEEKELLMRDVKIMHENFIEAVAENRHLDIEKVRELADGSSMLGEMALENGLIDKIGGINEAKEYIREITGEESKVCW